MKSFFVFLVCCLALFSANSCKQCTECHNYPKKDIELCKKDFASSDSYAQAYRYTLSLGYDCD
ncbi:MAG: hypothetical protein V4615_08720 [Bacteroidota bacterium]